MRSKALAISLAAGLLAFVAYRDRSAASAASRDTTTWGANDPTWSPDGKRIAFTLFGSIWTIDAQGGVEIKDRIKDVIKTGGEWISSLELESLISEHQAVLSVAVVGIADEQWGERPMALVVCEPGQYLDRKILEAHLQGFVELGRINKWAIPKQFKFVAEIPKTSVGKINKKLIREQALA